MGAYHWRHYQKKTAYRKLVNKILSFFPNKGSLLDIGCGDGLITWLLHKKGLDVEGFDNEPEAIKLARKQTEGRLVFYQMDLYRPPADFKKRFDYILAAEIIEHLERPEVLVERIRQWVREYAIITTPLKKGRKKDRYHLREYKPHELVEVLKPLKTEILKVDRNIFVKAYKS